MSRILILVEGQTEEVFVKELLAPHLTQFGVFLTPTILVTKWVKAGGHFRGGVTSYQRAVNDIKRLLGDSNAKAITTMLDYYGLPDDFPGMSSRPKGDCYGRVQHVEAKFKADIGDPRFDPYLALHEFETLLFTDPERCRFVFAGTNAARELKQMAAKYQSPEQIDEGPQAAPSKRIVSVYSGYQKPLHGPLATREIGLPVLRAKCPHFSEWVARLEAVGP